MLNIEGYNLHWLKASDAANVESPAALILKKYKSYPMKRGFYLFMETNEGHVFAMWQQIIEFILIYADECIIIALHCNQLLVSMSYWSRVW